MQSSPSPSPPPLATDAHVSYIQSLNTHTDEYEYWLTEHLRLNGVYWGNASLHLLGRPDGVPRAADMWEISRLVTSPAGQPGTRLMRVHRLLALALIEFALLNGIRHYVLVAESQRVPALLSIGWRVRPLSLPTSYDDQLLEVLQIDVEEETGDRLRERLGIAASVFAAADDVRRAA